MQVEGSTVLVTGANRGLGRALVEAFLKGGAAKVYAAARDPESVQVTDARVVPLRLDVTDEAQVRAAVDLAPDVDVVVNNAGIAEQVSVLAGGGVESLRRQLEVNAIGPLLVSRAFAPVLESRGGGAVVNVLSVLSWLTFAPSSTYSASKAAGWSITNALRGQLREQGTQVVGVHVAYMDTDMAADVEGPKLDPADLAAQVLDALESGATEVLGDDTTRQVKSLLSGPVDALAP